MLQKEVKIITQIEGTDWGQTYSALAGLRTGQSNITDLYRHEVLGAGCWVGVK